MRKAILVGLIGLILTISAADVPPAAAQPPLQSSDQYYVIELVNALRAEYGLPPYQINAQLMAAAQAHSEWAASIGTHSHTGAGGSTPTDRAVAAGYGGGNQVRVSENIYWGTRASAETALAWWRNSPLHFRGMTSTQYTEIGAGVAYSSTGGYFTLKFGVVGTAPAPAPQQPAAPGAAPLPTLPSYVVEPVEIAEPGEDGSVVHIVGEGQNLWAIAEGYDVALSEVMALNRLNERSIIRPGDRIVIVPAPVQTGPAATGPTTHIVEEGQTLFGIALSYRVELQTILELNGLYETSIIRPGDEIVIVPDPNATPAPRPPLTHVVQEGETLAGIAGQYRVDLNTLYALNGLYENSIIRPGDRIVIVPDPDATPAPRPPLVHIVQPGEMLAVIAALYRVDLNTLYALNALGPESVIHPGDRIVIRPGDPTHTPGPPTSTEPGSTPEAVSGLAPTLPPGEIAQSATITPSPTAELSMFGPASGEGSGPGRGLLIGGLVVVALAGIGLVLYGAVVKRPI